MRRRRFRLRGNVSHRFWFGHSRVQTSFAVDEACMRSAQAAHMVVVSRSDHARVGIVGAWEVPDFLVTAPRYPITDKKTAYIIFYTSRRDLFLVI
jgi:hypothetical protein